MNEIIIPPARASAKIVPPRPPNNPYRILVVDDDADIRRLNTEVLVEAGYQVDAAKDGVDAWQALNTNRYDLLITDNNMPVVTGLELIKKLREEEMALPVILMSATMPTEELDRHPWLQIQATLRKPYALVELFCTVNEVLRMAGQSVRRVELLSNKQNFLHVGHMQQL